MNTNIRSATEKCEPILSEHQAYNLNHHILTSENAVISTLLNHSDSMSVVYQELFSTLNKQQLDIVLGGILSCAAFWNQERSAQYRKEKQELIETN